MTCGVGVEQVISTGIVLVDAALDEPHPEDARVEVEVLLSGPAIAVMWCSPSTRSIPSVWNISP